MVSTPLLLLIICHSLRKLDSVTLNLDKAFEQSNPLGNIRNLLPNRQNQRERVHESERPMRPSAKKEIEKDIVLEPDNDRFGHSESPYDGLDPSYANNPSGNSESTPVIHPTTKPSFEILESIYSSGNGLIKNRHWKDKGVSKVTTPNGITHWWRIRTMHDKKPSSDVYIRDLKSPTPRPVASPAPKLQREESLTPMPSPFTPFSSRPSSKVPSSQIPLQLMPPSAQPTSVVPFSRAQASLEPSRMPSTMISPRSSEKQINSKPTTVITPIKKASKPAAKPTRKPLTQPTKFPVASPTKNPTLKPTRRPVLQPTPTADPTFMIPSLSFTSAPVLEPTPVSATDFAEAPASHPTPIPVLDPTPIPLPDPTSMPVPDPTPIPLPDPTPIPVLDPTLMPALNPTPIPVDSSGSRHSVNHNVSTGEPTSQPSQGTSSDSMEGDQDKDNPANSFKDNDVAPRSHHGESYAALLLALQITLPLVILLVVMASLLHRYFSQQKSVELDLFDSVTPDAEPSVNQLGGDDISEFNGWIHSAFDTLHSVDVGMDCSLRSLDFSDSSSFGLGSGFPSSNGSNLDS